MECLHQVGVYNRYGRYYEQPSIDKRAYLNEELKGATKVEQYNDFKLRNGTKGYVTGCDKS